MDYEILGSILKDARSKLKITQSEIATKLGVTFQNVSSWERGKSKIDIDTLVTLCNIYGIDFTSALSRANNNSPVPAKAETGELSQDDLELLEDYHKLNESGREAARNAVRGLTFAPNLQQLKERHSVEMADIADDAIRTIDKLTEMTRKNQHDSLRKK